MTDGRLDRKSGGSFVEPFRHALDRMQERSVPAPDEITGRAVRLLTDRFGPSESREVTGFAYGVAGVQADHSHYFNGFALLKPMRMGTAAALRSIRESEWRIAVDGSSDTFRFELDGRIDDTPPIAARVALSVLNAIGAPQTGGVEVAIATSIPEGLESGFVASVAVAVLRAASKWEETSLTGEASTTLLKHAVEVSTGAPFSAAYVVGSQVMETEPFVLVDVETLEHLLVESPGKTLPALALVQTAALPRRVDRNNRVTLYREIVARLQGKRFTRLTSLRDLEHRDLEAAVALLPRRLRPALRSLVSENRRVQRLVAAIRSQDWQLMGALLLMSHSSRREDWMGTTALQDFVVDSAERFSLEGVYGAAQMGEEDFVLVAGQPYRLPAFLDHIRNNWPDQSAEPPGTWII
jgi:galactokinase